LELFVISFVEGSSSLAQTHFPAVWTGELVTPAAFVFVFEVGITVRQEFLNEIICFRDFSPVSPKHISLQSEQVSW